MVDIRARLFEQFPTREMDSGWEGRSENIVRDLRMGAVTTTTTRIWRPPFDGGIGINK